mgnify:CR=1 FL=1
MDKLRVSTRLTLLVGALSMALLILGGIALYGMALTAESLRTVYEDRTIPSEQIGEVRFRQTHARLVITEALANPTPEQLALLLASADAPYLFGSLKRIVLDELHALVTSKRGDLLSLDLARLWRLAPQVRAIGLSATVAARASRTGW